MSKTFSKNKDAKELEVPFTMVPNFALDTIEMRSPAENCLYFVIIRQTVGYLNQNGLRKSKADLSISRLVKLTGLSRQGVLNSRRNLYDAGWILYRINSSMTSYGIIDRYDEFRKKLESTELTETSQLSRQEQSTELTEPSQLSRHIKEKEIKSIKEIEIKEHTPTLSEQIKELALKHNLTYSNNPNEQSLFLNKLMNLNYTNDRILEQATRFFEIVKREPKLNWIHSFSFGFKFLQFNWDKIEALHNAHKPQVREFKKPESSMYAANSTPPTLEQLERMCK